MLSNQSNGTVSCFEYSNGSQQMSLDENLAPSYTHFSVWIGVEKWKNISILVWRLCE